jgi:cysteine desulfurase
VIYFDYNATTPVLPEVFEAMRPYFCNEWGNPSSAYRFGSKLKTIIGSAREQVADLVSALPEEILFTSCATESNNAAIQSVLKSNPAKRHIITSAVEHSSVLNHCLALEKEGYRVTYLPVDQDGLLNMNDLENALNDQTAVVSLMWANNETGVLFPVEKIAEVCQSKGVLFHCDAAQAVGKVPIDVTRVHVDYLTISAHKIFGPKGVGALFIRRNVLFSPMLLGGHQENERRGGTENVPLLVGFGRAADLVRQEFSERVEKCLILQDYLEKTILAHVLNTSINGCRDNRICTTSNIHFTGVDSDALVTFLDARGICVSSGSACISNAIAPSHVILAMTGSVEKAKQSIRFSIAHTTTHSEIDFVVNELQHACQQLK